MNVKITRALTPSGDNFFYLYVDGSFFKAFFFRPEITEPESISSEQYVYKQVKEMADRIEGRDSMKDFEETVYETPLQIDSNGELK